MASFNISEESNIQDDRWYDLLGFTKKPLLPGGRPELNNY